MKITYFGHACFLIEINQKKILFDPFLSENPWTKNVSLPDFDIDYILVTHGHIDHLGDTVGLAAKSGAKVICNFEIKNWLEVEYGVKNLHAMNIGGKFFFDFGLLRMVAAQHSSVLPDGTYGGNPCGFVVESKDGNFYFAGDTGLTSEMKIIPDLVNLDFSFLPLGDNFTMGVNESIIATQYLKCNKVIGMHFNTFPIIEIDREKTELEFKKAGIEIIFINIGESFNFKKNETWVR